MRSTSYILGTVTVVELNLWQTQQNTSRGVVGWVLEKRKFPKEVTESEIKFEKPVCKPSPLPPAAEAWELDSDMIYCDLQALQSAL